VQSMRVELNSTYPVYEYGRMEYVSNKITESINRKESVFPLIVLVMDFKEDFSDGLVKVTVPIIFFTNTTPHKSNDQRYSDTFPTLYDLLDLFQKELGKHEKINTSYPEYNKIDSAYYKGRFNVLNDNTDVVACEFDLEIVQDSECEYVAPTTFDLVLTAETGGTTVPTPGTYTENNGAYKAFYASPNSGYRFLRWLLSSGEQLTNPLAVVYRSTMTLVAQFIAQFQLTTSVTGNGTITPSSGLKDDGETVTLTATPDAGNHFVDWVINSVQYLTSTVNYTITQATTAVATFAIDTVNLVMSRVGNGTIVPDVGTHPTNPGDTVVLTATESDSGYYFRDWDIDGTIITDNPYSLLVDEAKNVEATFLPYPSYLFDGNTVAWYDSKDLTTITKDGGNLVSLWKDKLLSGNNVAQATALKQPIWSADGLLFDGLLDGNGDFLRGSFTLNQPEFIYLVFQQKTWHSSGAIIDGFANYSGLLHQTGFTEFFKPYANTYGPSCPYVGNADGTTGGYLNKTLLTKVLFNGANSSIKLNGSFAQTGDFGTKNMAGLTIGANSGSDRANVLIKEIIIRKTADDSSTQLQIYNYLKNKYKTRTIGFVGDSTISNDTSAPIDWGPMSKLMSGDFLRIDISAPGATIAQNKTRWGTNKGDDMDAVYFQSGLNDLGMSSSALIAAYQDMVDTIRLSLTTGQKIIIGTMIPCNRSGDQQWVDLNDAILGLGSTPITGVDGRIDTVNTALNNGSNGLAAIYDVGDGLHENNAGRQIIADLLYAKLIELGVF